MNTIDGDLAQNHLRDLHHDAEANARARRVRNARRWHRRADRASQRARQAQSQIR
ncbi:MAG: hypothetical protein H0V10_04775 [Geodermatophilaceae bacterium]|nr:hypothetical protein [Geodermatophilaceae bacterium]